MFVLMILSTMKYFSESEFRIRRFCLDEPFKMEEEGNPNVFFARARSFFGTFLSPNFKGCKKIPKKF